MVRFIIFLLAAMAVGGANPDPSVSGLSTNARGPVNPPKPPPVPRTPVDLFRELLAMPPAEREKAVTNRSSQARAFLEGKLKEFESLSAPVREERLQTLQLRWHLLPLMRISPSQRAARLNALLEGDRRLVEERLAQWDQLPEELQRKVLENENVIRLFIRPETNAPRIEITSTNLWASQREQMEKDQARWQAMSEQDHQRILDEHERLFKLNARERERILNRMADQERRQMETTLRRFARLPTPQREACLRGFQKFTALSPREQEEFLTNAERWQAMTPKDRQLWRDLVARLQPKPPLPPGLRAKTPPLPPGATAKKPVPPARPPASSRALTTN
jgi:hypothetical protein